MQRWTTCGAPGSSANVWAAPRPPLLAQRGKDGHLTLSTAGDFFSNPMGGTSLASGGAGASGSRGAGLLAGCSAGLAAACRRRGVLPLRSNPGPAALAALAPWRR